MRKSHKVAIILSTMVLLIGAIFASALIGGTKSGKLSGVSIASALVGKVQPDKLKVEPGQEAQIKDNANNCEDCDGKETTATPPPGYGKTTVMDTTLEEAQAETSFKIRKPSYLPSDAREKVQLVKDRLGDGKVMTSVILNYNVPSADRKFPTGEVHKGGFAVFQIPGEGPQQTLFPTTDIEIDGVTGKVQAPQGVGITPIQVFWTKDGVYYNVVGEGLSKEELIKIARSLK